MRHLPIALAAALLLLAPAEPLSAATTAERAAMQSELDRLADQVVLPRAFNLVHRLVGPSVVSVHTSQTQVVTRFGRPVGTRAMEVGEGSGFVFHSDDEASWILTNAHVVVRVDRRRHFIRDRYSGEPLWFDGIQVATHDGSMVEAEAVGADLETDLAVLKVPVPNLPAVTWADSDRAQVGEYVVALGYPMNVGYSATFGNISATERSTGIYGESGREAFIQTDAAINPGNSGGPLVDLRGHVIGVNANIVTRDGGSLGIGFAIPANLAESVAHDLRQDGEVDRPTLGVRLAPLRPEVIAELEIPNVHAVLIDFIFPDSPAAEAGLAEADVIIGVDESPIAGYRQLLTRIAATPRGDSLVLDVWREGERLAIEVTPVERRVLEERLASQVAERQELVWEPFGLRLGSDGARGAVVTGVESPGPAASAGLRPGDRILEVYGHGDVTTPADLAGLDERRQLVLIIQRGGDRRLVNLQR